MASLVAQLVSSTGCAVNIEFSPISSFWLTSSNYNNKSKIFKYINHFLTINIGLKTNIVIEIINK